MFHGLFLILSEFQCIKHLSITLGQLAGCKSARNARALSVVLDQMHYAVQAAVNSAAVIILGTEICTGRNLLILSYVYGMLHQFLDTLTLCGRYGHHRDTQNTLHLIDAYRSAVTRQLIHHVQGQNHRHAQFHQLDSQVEVTLYVGCINDIYDAVGFLLNDELA